jgi:hypothetical protein
MMMHTTMRPTILAAALELSRIHGTAYAAFFLLDRDIAFDVIAELLWDARTQYEFYPPGDEDPMTLGFHS